MRALFVCTKDKICLARIALSDIRVVKGFVGLRVDGPSVAFTLDPVAFTLKARHHVHWRRAQHIDDQVLFLGGNLPPSFSRDLDMNSILIPSI